MTPTDLRQFIPSTTLNDAGLQSVIDFANADISRFSTVQDDKREEQIVRWCKVWLAFDGLTEIEQVDYRARWDNTLSSIASERRDSPLGLFAS